MDNIELYELGIKAKNGDEMAMLEIIKAKRNLIRRYSYNN